jgi:hypothetical protein
LCFDKKDCFSFRDKKYWKKKNPGMGEYHLVSFRGKYEKGKRKKEQNVKEKENFKIS